MASRVVPAAPLSVMASARKTLSGETSTFSSLCPATSENSFRPNALTALAAASGPAPPAGEEGSLEFMPRLQLDAFGVVTANSRHRPAQNLRVAIGVLCAPAFSVTTPNEQPGDQGLETRRRRG